MTLPAVLVIFGLLAGILFSIEVGYRSGQRRWARLPKNARIVPPAIEGSIFGLMGLLAAFTFYGAGSRFDNRRTLITQEANAIGTAYLRLDLLPPEAQPPLRDDFRAYVESRLDVYRQIPDVAATNAALERSSALQLKLWKNVVTAVRAGGAAEKSLLLTALNEVIDITTARTVALSTHPPAAIFVMLGVSIVASSVLAGYGMSIAGVRDWASIVAFALVLTAAMYVILDYEFPRVGLIRIDPVDEVLVRTLKSMTSVSDVGGSNR
jgi:hypothetical protein